MHLGISLFLLTAVVEIPPPPPAPNLIMKLPVTPSGHELSFIWPFFYRWEFI